MPCSHGWTPFPRGGEPRKPKKRSGRICILNLVVEGAANGNWKVLGTIPSGFRPHESAGFSCFQGLPNSIRIAGHVLADGNVQVFTYGTETNVRYYCVGVVYYAAIA